MSSDLSVTLAPMVADQSGDAIKAALDRIAAMRLRYVHIAATMPGLRPRDLDRAARRDLIASLRRRELALSGLDAWIPPAHFIEPSSADRAVQAVNEILGLAADLGRVPVSIALPADEAVAATIIDSANRNGVTLADHAIPMIVRDGVEMGIDPAAYLALNLNPVDALHARAARLASARLVDLLRSGMRGPIGSLHEDRLEVMAYKIALSVIGYCHPVIIDTRQWSDPWGGIAQTQIAWQAM